jgi:DtxR family Mn-dependent transcriptional regulator
VTTAQRPGEAVENYAKAIYALQHRAGAVVTTNALAERLGVTAASASGMVKKLGTLGLVRHEPYRGVELTDEGERLALEVLRHHRLLELYLAERLGMPWDRVHDEAEVLEHVISEELEALIADKLDTMRMQDLDAGDRGVFVRISDSDPEMLRYLGDRGIAPGDRFEVVEKQPFAGPVFVRFGGETHVLGGTLAEAMRVEVAA